jgi:hypothetical protein
MEEREPKSERRVTGDEFAETLRQYLPAVAVDRLGSVEEQRDSETVPESGADGSVEDVLTELGIDYTPFERWGDEFLRAMNLASVEPFPDVFARIPRPPDEPPALWERLLLKAHTPGPAGVSACLLLHTLACARTVRVLK